MLSISRRRRTVSSARLIALSATMLWLVQNAAGQELSIFALQGPGQASVAIDRSTKTAHIIDLGRDGDGDQLLLEGKPLIDVLQSPEYGVTQLTITCSHPHADHHGGIMATLRNHRNFVREGRPVFGAKIPIIESAMPPARSLASILNSTGRAIGVTAQSRDGRKPDAYSGFSKPGDDVFIESIPYTPRNGGTGAHGGSIITKVTLGSRHIHLDFDDANNAVIREVVAKLKNDGVKIDSFVVPHHGSAAHDVDPILELRRSPEARITAIISVDPRNRYGHPAPEILAQLMKSVGKENVVLTGSRPNDRVVITPEGVIRAPYTAAMRDVFALFVIPAMVRLKTTRSAAMKTAYGEIWEMMSGGKEGPPPDPVTVAANPRPPKPGSGGSAAIAEQVIANGTALSEAFDAGQAHLGRITPEQTRARRIRAPSADRGSVPVFAAADSRGDAALRQLGQTRTSIDPKIPIFVNALTDSSVPDLRQPVVLRRARRPDGGMVNLTGNNLMTSPDAQILIGSTVEKCGVGLCLITDPKITGAASAAFRLPFNLSVTAAAVWSRTYKQGLDQLYLSIDPTKRLLDRTKGRSAVVPAGKLQFGDNLPNELRNNRVVTQGDIEGSVIGRILWEADVAFKSQSLGFNVLTGMRPQAVAAVDITRDEDFSGALLRTRTSWDVDQEDRWCRMFWESGEQFIAPDRTTGAVRFRGKAVVAHGEAMRLENGKLRSFPSGDWCDDAKAVAATLESQANGPGSTGTLRDLRDLAEMQNFWRWARSHSVKMSKVAEESLEALVERDKGFKVPVWTSGVRSTDPVMVQYERKVGAVESQLLHIRYGDTAVVDNCVMPKWLARKKELANVGIAPDPITGELTGPRVFQKVDGWMKEFSEQVAECAHGKDLPSRFQTTRKDDEDNPRTGRFGFVRHPQPTEIHGGIVLGRSVPVFRDVVQKNSNLDDPKGRPVLRSAGGSLHFWADSPDYSIAEHVEIRDASLIEAYPGSGKLRFLVRRSGDSILRHELRTINSPALKRGLEWFGLYGPAGEKYMEKATWPCADGEEDCAWVSDLDETDLDRFLFNLNDREAPGRLIEAVPVNDNVWLITLQSAHIEHMITGDQSREDTGDGSLIAAQARALAWWGFEATSALLAGKFEKLAAERWGSVDYVAAYLAPDQKKWDLLASIVKIEDYQRKLKATPQSAPLDQTVRFERTLNKLPIAGSELAWVLLQELCDNLDSARLTPQQESIRAAMRGRIASKILLAKALTGETDPVTQLFELLR